MIIPVIEKIKPDEDFYEWIQHIAHLNVMSDTDFKQRFFSLTDDVKANKRLSDLGLICDSYKDQWFPSMEDVLYQHTSLMVEAFFENQYVTAERINQIINFHIPNTINNNAFKYCPICAKEDMEKYGRVIAHVPHQIKGINSCYKHNVVLATDPDSEIVSSDDDDWLKSKMVFEVYRAGIIGHIEDFPYLEATKIRTKVHGGNTEYNFNLNKLYRYYVQNGISLLIEYYRSHQESYIKTAKDILARENNKIVGKGYSAFIMAICGCCKKKYDVWYQSAAKGIGCPYCERNMDIKTILSKKTSYTIPDYQLEELSADSGRYRASFRHLKCNHVIDNIPVKKALMRGYIKCPNCDAHIGETRKMNCGLHATIVAYRKYQDIDIRFENGAQRCHVAYWTFLKGSISPKNMRLGETRKMNCGLHATIVAYRNSQDIDIKFENGARRSHVMYSTFKKGEIPPKREHTNGKNKAK